MKKVKPLWIILSSLSAVLMVATIIGGSIADTFKNTINSYFGLQDYRLETIGEEEDIDSEYFKSEYVLKDEDGNIQYVTDDSGYKHQAYDTNALINAGKDYSYQVQQEGTTLLWNNAISSSNTGLPLKEGDKLSLFGITSVRLWLSGVGSGNANVLTYDNFKTQLENAGFDVNDSLWSHYVSYRGGFSYKRGQNEPYMHTFEPAWSSMSSSVKSTFASFNDAAIIGLTRVSGEYIDVNLTGAETISGDYLGISQNEKDMIENVISLKKSGTFKKVILLLNTATSLNWKELKPYQSDIDSCLWIGQGGTAGFQVLSDILLGERAISGHLPDTYAMDGRSAPAAVNALSRTYSNYSKYNLKTKLPADRDWASAYYIPYAEGIYVGYKYYETRYEDAVMDAAAGRSNATSTVGAVNSTSNWKYSEEVAFPFGYGKSLTSFEYSNFDVTKNTNGSFTATVTVKNNGTQKGKDAVQIYVQKPYTEYDKSWGVEQAAVNLCGIAKTKELKKGQSETISIDIDADAIATYDANNKRTYIREKGDYYFAIGEDAHNATNNILAKKGYTPGTTHNVMDAAGNADFVKKFNFASDDFSTFATSSTGYKITNQFDSVDWNKYENKTAKDITYLSRSDWSGTYPKENFSLSINQSICDDLSNDTRFVGNPNDVMPTFGASHQFNLIDARGLEYDHDVWEKLLDQLTWDECIKMNHGLYTISQIPSIGSPGRRGYDGPLGIFEAKTNFQIEPLLGATFNKELVRNVGRVKGEDMLHNGKVDTIYGPGVNIHRTAYGGRSYEYYSEDGFLTGEMCCAETMGIQDKGCVALLKHFALNDQEDQRWGVGIWANEQSIREIYLQGFRPAVEKGKALGMMSAFSRFGTQWCGANYGLLTEVLRNEWGFKGYVDSDCPYFDYMNLVDGYYAGNDAILYDSIPTSRYNAYKNDPTFANCVRESTHRILYAIVNSYKMNGITANTRVIPITTWWQYAITGAQIGFGALTVMFVAFIFIFKKKVKEN